MNTKLNRRKQTAASMGLGIALGVALGAALGNIALGGSPSASSSAAWGRCGERRRHDCVPQADPSSQAASLQGGLGIAAGLSCYHARPDVPATPETSTDRRV